MSSGELAVCILEPPISSVVAQVDEKKLQISSCVLEAITEDFVEVVF